MQKVKIKGSKVKSGNRQMDRQTGRGDCTTSHAYAVGHSRDAACRLHIHCAYCSSHCCCFVI